MLDIKRVLASAPKSHDRGEASALYTPWGEMLDAECVLPEHPRPQCARERFGVLNGFWEYAFVACSSRTEAKEAWRTVSVPESFDGQVLVPFTPGTLLSGVDRMLQPAELLWYRRTFEVPELDAGERLILHFDSVDYACACYINGVPAGEHVGGYLPFSLDVTDAVAGGSDAFGEDCAANSCLAGGGVADGCIAGGRSTGDHIAEIALCVFDPSDEGVQLRGKQRLDAGGIWYTPQGGIWQTVWWEVVPKAHIAKLDISADMYGNLLVSAEVVGGDSVFEVTVREAVNCGDTIVGEAATLQDEVAATRSAGKEVPAGEVAAYAAVQVAGTNGASTRRTLTLHVENARLWSVDDPCLYDLEIRYGNDCVRSYCGFRTVSMEEDAQGVKRFYLNGSPVFLRGVLDQGYWSDGLMTAPSDAALVHDISAMKELGFNMLRKHIKVECARWYYHCDRLGMLVWQDAVSGGGSYGTWQTSYKPTLLRASWHRKNDAKPARYADLSAGASVYRAEWEATCLQMIDYLRNHPSVVTWVLFNEAWGQFEARKMTQRVRAADGTRPVDSVSGWYDQSCGDFLSVHNYFRDLEVWRDHAKPDEVRDCANASGTRAFVISEFGGLTFAVPEHCMFEGSYGYESFADAAAWRAGLRDLLAEVDALEAQGLAGFVYTQVSDVEEEVNGILTFDRRVNKLAEGGVL